MLRYKRSTLKGSLIMAKRDLGDGSEQLCKKCLKAKKKGDYAKTIGQ